MRKIETLALLTIILLTACNNKEVKKNEMPTQQQLEEMNRQMVHSNSKAIDTYIEKNNWNAVTTGTGLRYFIYEKGMDTNTIKVGSEVTFQYSLTTLNGGKIVDINKPIEKTILVEKQEAESGIHEVLKLLHKGDKVKFILPPHLAFGLTGAENIPPLSTLVYDLRIIQVDTK